MRGRPDSDSPWLLRRLARLIVRGADARYILGDLDEGWIRDRAKGRSVLAASLRYASNAVTSAAVIAIRRLRDGGPATSWLDVKLGLRMLRRQPAMTAVALFALGIGIPVAMVPGQIERALTADLPFEDGHQIVGILTSDLETSLPWTRTLHEFELWQTELRSFQSLGAWDGASYNVTVEDGRAEPVEGAAITASAFGIVRAPPLLGRGLLPTDEAPGSPAVVVLGHGLWQSALGADPDAIGRTIRVSGVPHEVVGVMPEGFRFPENERLWIPFRERAINHEFGDGPTIQVFGRLAEGVTKERASAEVEQFSQRLAVDYPATHGHLHSRVVGFTMLSAGFALEVDALWLGVKVLGLLLLGLVCGNVGILILARTGMRTSEIAVRTALGASRRRIVTQIFVETLLTALIAVSFGLLLAAFVGEAGHRTLGNELPFWLDFGIQWETVVVALVLGAASAALAGVIPALKATSGKVSSNLRHAGRGGSSMRFGGFSSALIVAEVAVAVAFLTLGGPLVPQALGSFGHGAGVDPDQYLLAQAWHPGTRPGLELAELDEETFRQQLARIQLEVARTLGSEASVAGVAMGSSVSGASHSGRWVEVEDLPRTDGVPAHWVRTATVLPGFFEGLGREAVTGRTFDSLDPALTASGNVVVVNTRFVEEVLGGRNAAGRRIRTVARGGTNPGEWLEIVGVVPRLGMNVTDARLDAGFYLPATPGELNPVQIAVHVEGDPAAFGGRLREVVAAVDAELQVETAGPMTAVISSNRMDGRWGLLLFGTVAMVAIVLSAAGLYALVGFTVSRRTREIGIRTALGASKERIAADVATRALLQLSAGVTVGAALALVLVPQMFSGPGMVHVRWGALVAMVGGAVFVIGVLALLPPVIRGLRITPMAALAEE